jgi:rhamnulokinase
MRERSLWDWIAMNQHYLAFDLGAESGRSMLGELADGRLELRELRRFPNEPVALPTGLYWDTLRLFHEITQGLRAAGHAAARLDGVAIDTWGVDFGLLGSDGALIDNPRHYRDARTGGMVEQVFRKVSKEEIYAATGVQFMELNSLYQLYAVRQQSPWLLENAGALLFMPDLLNYFLTGEKRSEVTIASTSQFYNPVAKQFANELLSRLGIRPDLLAPLIDPGARLGRLLPRVAADSGWSKTRRYTPPRATIPRRLSPPYPPPARTGAT